MIALVLTGLATLALAGNSPFPSTVPGISIPNAHLVAKAQGTVLRGSAPEKPNDAQELEHYGVTDILMFRNDTSRPLAQIETALFSSANFSGHITAIPFPWKDITDFGTVCRESLQGLRLIQSTLATKGKALYFHCSEGEDRTGYLAGLYRVVLEGKTADDAFQNEMCAHGYAEGDPRKVPPVASAIHNNLTVLFLKMLYLQKEGRLKGLSDQACASDPAKEAKFQQQVLPLFKQFRCKR